jgi:hypothetical protein
MKKHIGALCVMFLSTFMLFDCDSNKSNNGSSASFLLLLSNQTKSVSSQVTYYTTQIQPAISFTRSLVSSSPTSNGTTETQIINANGSVTLTITDIGAYADCGFYSVLTTLGALNGIHIETTPGSHPIGINIYFDKDNNGEFFDWTNNVYTGTGADAYIIGPSSVGGVLDVNSGTLFKFPSPDQKGDNYTLAQLKSGSAPGITSDTHIAVWIGLNGLSGSLNSTISVLSIY